MLWRLPWQRYNASKRPFETQIFQNNLKTIRWPRIFFSFFENSTRFSSLLRDMRKIYVVELELFRKELLYVEKKFH